jgi:hypothetical protein
MLYRRESERQTAGVAAWRDSEAAVLEAGPARSRISPTPAAKGRASVSAAFSPDAIDWGAMPRTQGERQGPNRARCHELRVNDRGQTWRIIYRIDFDAIVILEVFAKKTGKTPRQVIDICQQRLQKYDSL